MKLAEWLKYQHCRGLWWVRQQHANLPDRIGWELGVWDGARMKVLDCGAINTFDAVCLDSDQDRNALKRVWHWEVGSFIGPYEPPKD